MRPFEADRAYLAQHLDEMVEVTINDLTSAFLILPRGENFIEYQQFRAAYEVLKRHTKAFHDFEARPIWEALIENSRVFCVVRAILGMTPPEWADLARAETGTDVTQGAARSLDQDCRANLGYVSEAQFRLERKGGEPSVTIARLTALMAVAVKYIKEGAPGDAEGVVHRLAKFDTQHGIESLAYAANEQVPYAVLLYERYLGRPFATHRDAVSGLVGEVMENAIEERLRAWGITYRKTKRAERIPGFGQAPDFCIPDEVSPIAIIEAKITSDDGTARDKVARIKVLAAQRDAHMRDGSMNPYEVIACIDGRGFRERWSDMGQMLTALNGKVFTTATLDQLVHHTELRHLAVER